MKATELNDKELRREIYALRRALRTDIKEVKDISTVSSTIPTYATSHMTKAEEEMRLKSIRKREGAELLSIYRELKYIRGLKTSTLEGALEVAEKFEPLAKELRTLSEVKRKEFWDIYKKMYEENPLYEKFKYDIFQINDEIFQGNSANVEDVLEDETIIKDKIDFDKVDKDTILTTIKSMYDETMEAQYGELSEAEKTVLFTEKLSNLLSKLK